MKNFVFTILISLNIFFSTSLFSQNYYPFPTSEAIWNIVGDNCLYPVGYRIRFGLYGDTIINSKLYSKIFDLYDSTLIHPYSTYFGAIRENDEKQVFLLMEPYPEILLYDFSLNVGDTIWYEYGGAIAYGNFVFWQQSHYRVVLNIDSILLENNEYRKRISFSGVYSMSDVWVEGIGSIIWAGLLNPIITDIVTNGDGYYFACFKHHGQVFYLNNPFCDKCFCQLLSDINILNNNQLGIKIFPNPSINNINIEFKNSNQIKYTLSLYNAHGQLVRQIDHITTERVIIERENLKTGIYYFQLKSKNNINCGKFIFK